MRRGRLLGILLGTSLATAACLPAPSGSPVTTSVTASATPSTEPTATAEPTASPTETPSPTPDQAAVPIFAAGTQLKTLTTVRLRDLPGTNSGTHANLPLGAAVQVVAGPIRTDGYGWYLVRDVDPAAPTFIEGGSRPDSPRIRSWRQTAPCQARSPLIRCSSPAMRRPPAATSARSGSRGARRCAGRPPSPPAPSRGNVHIHRIAQTGDRATPRRSSS